LVQTIYDINENKQKLKNKLNAINDLIDMSLDQNAIQKLFIPNIGLVISAIEANILNFVYKNSTEQYEMNKKGFYEILIYLLENPLCKSSIFKKSITFDFINKFVQLFDSGIVEEKKYLKIILHRLYSKLIKRRIIIRNAITDYLKQSIKSKINYNGIPEILEVMASIISGYSVPLKKNHTDFFNYIIVPLFTLKKLNLYLKQLMKCSYLFLEKDHQLYIPLLQVIIEIWPSQNINKKVFFLNELKNILRYMDNNVPPSLMDNFFQIISKCLTENEINIATKTVDLFEIKQLMSFIKKNKKKNIIKDTLMSNLNHFIVNHWNKKIRDQLASIKKKIWKKNSSRSCINTVINNEGNLIISLYPGKKEEEDATMDTTNIVQNIEDEQYKNEISILLPNEDDNNKLKSNLSNNLDLNLSCLKIDESRLEEFDEDFGICPITQDYMEHPVLCPSGHYYERSALEEWLKDHNTEPLTRMYLSVEMLVEDPKFRQKIIDYRKKFNK
jgi:serine/threonine-protein phosphatase 2A regulatory subunit B'